MNKHFVTFFSPGTFVAEADRQEIDSWDVVEAQKRSKRIKQRYEATPYAFQFSTRTRGPDDLDSRVSKTSCMYFLDCKVETLEGVIARNDPNDKILISNMECNGWGRVATTTKGWKWTQPMREEDVNLITGGE